MPDDEYSEEVENGISWKGIGYLPTLSDFNDSYKKTLNDTKKYYGQLTKPLKRGKKSK